MAVLLRAGALILLVLAGCTGWDEDGDGVVGYLDCDDTDPDVVDPTLWYPDYDGDFWGAPEGVVAACERPEGFIERSGDCDDDSEETYPGAVEVCDETDNNCNGEIDDRPEAPPVWMPDLDEDGWGNATAAVAQCAQPDGYIDVPGDCDDTDPDINPDAEEIYYDGVDSNCDMRSDNDADEDGFDANRMGGDDCDDDDPTTHPLATERCLDGADQDCDGVDLTVCDAYGTVDLASVRGRVDTDSGTGGGMSFAVLGDATGDGIPDMAVGGPLDSELSLQAGSLYVVEGPLVDRTGVPDGAWASVVELAPLSQWGGAVVAVGDVDGDLVADLAAAAPGAGADLAENGEVRLLVSPFDAAQVHALWVGAGRDDRAGSALATAFHAAGVPDLVIGAPEGGDDGEGAVHVVTTSAVGPSSLASVGSRWVGQARGDETGAAVAAGDLDGDGVADVVLGAPRALVGEEEAGVVYVVFGPPPVALALADQADLRIAGAPPGLDVVSEEPLPPGRFGASVSVTGDLDGDGRRDLAAGAPDQSDRRLLGGAAYVFSALDDPASVDEAFATVLAHHEMDELGAAVAGAGDVDGDDLADLAVGAPGAHDGTFLRAGRTYVLHGPLQREAYAWEAATALAGERPGAAAGRAVMGLGDLDGDGLDELAVGAIDTVYLVYGAPSW